MDFEKKGTVIAEMHSFPGSRTHPVLPAAFYFLVAEERHDCKRLVGI